MVTVAGPAYSARLQLSARVSPQAGSIVAQKWIDDDTSELKVSLVRVSSVDGDGTSDDCALRGRMLQNFVRSRGRGGQTWSQWDVNGQFEANGDEYSFLRRDVIATDLELTSKAKQLATSSDVGSLKSRPRLIRALRPGARLVGSNELFSCETGNGPR